MNGKTEKFFIYFCVFAAAAGAVLRFIHINGPLAFDEIFTVVTSNPAFGLKHIIKEFLIPDVHPPLFNIIMYFWQFFVRYSGEWALRIPALIFSFGALAAGWFFYPANRDKTEKYIFTVFMSASWITVSLSAHARSYSLVLFLSVLLTFLTINMAEKLVKEEKIPAKYFAAYFILTLLASYTHYVGAAAAGAQTLVLLGYAFYKKRYFWTTAALYFLVLVLMFPWVWAQAAANADNLNGQWWNTLSGGWAVSLSGVLEAFTTNYYAGLLIWAGVIFSLVYIGKKDKKALSDVFILFPVLTVIISTLILWAAMPKINFFLDRLFTPLLPPGFLIFAFFMTYAAKNGIYFYMSILRVL